MLHNAINWLRRLVGAEPLKPNPNTTSLTTPSVLEKEEITAVTEEHIGTVVPYDENLLERAHTQWQFGDWKSLAAIERTTLEHHPDRARLALLAAAGQLQTGASGEARKLIQLAQKWGCSRRLIGQILIAGVHNNLGRAAASGGQEAYALKHFKSSVAIGSPSGDTRLLTQARVAEQISQLKSPKSTSNRISPAK
ncbi:hypothetical protein [Azotobacter chroococcum]|uniref:Uncharacterized protein n=1 Tax=Azotobacter chroococcum TaxID=353 RepID=A0AAP9YG21_9GAMM|nr:hypothetical protein [Azotobacter chroococcum]QQE90051.1 hypothetical protein GKQ51_06990 [Azotobacter chroococcum]